MAYCEETRFGPCLRSAFYSCAKCGIGLCYQHSYFDKGERLCTNCYIVSANPEKICHVCGEFLKEDPRLKHCERCHEYACDNCRALIAIELKEPAADLLDFDGAGNDMRDWCRKCIENWFQDSEFVAKFFFPEVDLNQKPIILRLL